jgi:alkyl sulfatase BDS1-like metallo-beta-lactamase superfamily hydrolase
LIKPNYKPAALAVSAMIAMLLAGTGQAQTAREAEPATQALQANLLKTLPFGDTNDLADAKRGFIGTIPNATIKGADGRLVWTVEGFDFLDKGNAPATVNPSLWRFARLQNLHGLFHVAGGIYQVRGFDVSNMTIVEGKTGLIIIDPLLATESAKAALDLYFQHRPRKPVRAVIYTHSHVDHFGGVKGVVSEDDVKAGKVAVIAPAGFMEHAIAENVLAGNAMSRRAQYQFGAFLDRGARGTVDSGMGKALAVGTVTLIPPTKLIEKDRETLTIDGVEIEMMLAQGTEAPSEMMMYFPAEKVFNSAEVATTSLHQLYTIRGAEIRDGNAWARSINQALARFGDRTEVTIAQHTWPVFGKARVQASLKKQRDTYKFINDQSLRLLNHGYKPAEIAETLRLPASLDNDWTARGYYGTVRHNAKAVYQKYLGWYDANPANLDPVTPAEQGRKFVEYAGGAGKVIERARADYRQGQYRWVAQAMSQVVFAEPGNRAARELGADALEQLGYQAESAIWRNAYLQGALELRNGIPSKPAVNTLSPDTLRALTLDNIFDFLGVRLNAPKAEGRQVVLNWNFSDSGKRYVLNLENAALTYLEDAANPKANATLTLTRETLDAILLQRISFKQAVADGKVKIEGDGAKVTELLGLFDNFTPNFEIVAPNGNAAKAL